MVLQSVFTRGVTEEGLDVPAFTTLILAIVFGWLLVSVYQRVLENLAYQTLGLNSRSTVHALIVALLTTIIFVATVWVIDEYEILTVEEAAEAAAAATGGVIGEGSGTGVLTSQIANSTRFGHPVVLLPSGM